MKCPNCGAYCDEASCRYCGTIMIPKREEFTISNNESKTLLRKEKIFKLTRRIIIVGSLILFLRTWHWFFILTLLSGASLEMKDIF